MNRQLIALALVFSALPAAAWAQAPCGCSPRSASVIRPAGYEAWADYQPAGVTYDGCGCGGCGCSACCDPCCRPLLCIIPNTVRRIGRTLDCLLPCGPRSGHGCGLSCIGAGSGCMGISCSHEIGCGCAAPAAVGNPFQDDPMPPSPPKPMPQETRRQPNRYQAEPRQLVAAPVAPQKMQARPRPSATTVSRTTKSASSEVSQANLDTPVSKKPISVLKRASATSEDDEDTLTVTTSARRRTDIPHNPLR